MPKPFLVDRRDHSRVYLYTEQMARNPYLEETDTPPTAMAHDTAAVARATQLASRLQVDQKAIEQARDGNALMLQANTGQADAKVKRDIDARAKRRKELLATSPSEAVDGRITAAPELPPPAFILPEAALPE